MQHHREGIILDAATLREDLAVMEKQIQSNPRDNGLIDRYLAYARKVREIEHRDNGYVTARPPRDASWPLSQMLEDSPCC